MIDVKRLRFLLAANELPFSTTRPDESVAIEAGEYTGPLFVPAEEHPSERVAAELMVEAVNALPALLKVYEASDRRLTEPRIPTAKTWRELERMATGDHLQLFRTEGCVSVLSIETPARPVVTITTEILRDEDADRVVRRALEAALDALGGLHR